MESTTWRVRDDFQGLVPPIPGVSRLEGLQRAGLQLEGDLDWYFWSTEIKTKQKISLQLEDKRQDQIKKLFSENKNNWLNSSVGQGS